MRLRALGTNSLGTKETLCINHKKTTGKSLCSSSFSSEGNFTTWGDPESKNSSSRFRKETLHHQGEYAIKKPIGSVCMCSPRMLPSISRGPRFLGRVHTRVVSSPTGTLANSFHFFEMATEKSSQTLF